MQDIKNSEEYKNLWTRANYDDLTKVLNRRAGRERLISLFEKARTESRMLVVSLCDVNDLKQINDRYGHREGDKYAAICCTGHVPGAERKRYSFPVERGRICYGVL